MMKKMLPVVAAIAAFALQVVSVYMPGEGENAGAAPELSAVIFSALLSAAIAGVVVHLVLSFRKKK